MKKSKFLKNSKDMLSRSFNPSKCKTSLRLAGSRLKLLRNKKEVQVKQMKREIAKLLESGQDQTARIRVEHVIREEKMMAAYDLIEIYCELIVARLPIIESQKICPIDLKEAIASVVFASPRCGDVPELLDVKKHFTEKYGKDFTTAAIELRPECGVSRMLVEKLSAMAPDGQTKIKILSAIAEEHNVKWDPKSFEENSVPASDFLTGPSTLGKESKFPVEPSHFEGPDVQLPQSNNKLHGSPLNFTQVDHKTSLGTERLSSGQVSGVNTAFRHEARPAALGDDRAQLFQGDGNTIPLDRQRWNMEFKDATSAAQAAAESAELASMAARAAAELSSHGRIMRQYSSESHKSDGHAFKDGGPASSMNSKLFGEQYSEELMNRSFSDHSGLQNEQIDRMKPNNLKTDGRFKEAGHDGRKEYSQSVSLKSKASINDNSLDHGVPVIDGYSRKNSLKEVSRGEMSMQRQSFKYKAESTNGWPEKSDNVREERIGKQRSVESFHSHSSISNDVNIFSTSKDRKFEFDAGEDSFMGFGKEGIYGEATQTSSRESAAVVFDKSDSDSENHGFDLGPTYDEPRERFHLPLSGQKSREHLSTNTDSWSPRSSTSKTVKSSSSLFLNRKSSSSDFSDRSMDGSKLDDSMPLTFDESDGLTSESDEDINISRHTRISRDFPSKQNQSVVSPFKDKSGPSLGSPLKDRGSPGFDRKQLSLSSDDGLKSEGTDSERNQGKKFDADPPAKLSREKPSADRPALVPKKTQMELNYIGNSSPESEEGLNFEKLTGGFRHKGYNYLPNLKNRFDVSSSFNKGSEETTATISRSTAPPAVESTRIRTMFEHKKSRTPDCQSESDSDSSEEEESLQKSSDHKQEPYTLSGGKDLITKPSLAASNSIFGSDSSDSDGDVPKESLTRTNHLHSGISRRTKAFPSISGKTNYSKMQLRSEALDFDDGMDRKATTSDSSETPKRSEPKRNSSKLETYEQPTSTKVASKPAKPNFSNSGEATTMIMHESRVQLRSEAHDSYSSVERKPMKSYSAESQQQFQSLNGNFSQLMGNSVQPSSAKVASRPTNSSLWGTPDQHNSGKPNSVIQEPKIAQKPSAIEESSMNQKKAEASISRENLKAATLNKTSSNKDASNQKASHVHPKLPDYDTLVQSLRKNRS